jgi:hypothetical protein
VPAVIVQVSVDFSHGSLQAVDPMAEIYDAIVVIHAPALSEG